MKNKTPVLAVIVGIFAIVGVLILFSLSFQAHGPSLSDGYDIFTHLRDARGLEVGADVVRAGVPIGVVQDITLSPNKNRVLIHMRMRSDSEVRQDAIATIRLKSLLGTYQMHISHGSLKSPAAVDGFALESQESVDINEVLSKVSNLGDQGSGLFSSIDKNQRNLFDKLDTVIEENRENIQTVTSALSDAAPRVRDFSKVLKSAGDAIENQDGTFGALIFDSQMRDDFTSTAQSLRQITAHVKQGEGTLGKLLYDPDMSDQIGVVFANAEEISESLKQVLSASEEDIQAFFRSARELMPKVEKAIKGFETTGQNLADVTQRVKDGKGSLGKLINDDALYEEIRITLAQIRKTFEEGEEQSVLRTFLGVFLGGLM